MRFALALRAILVLAASAAYAEASKPKSDGGGSMFPGGNSKSPISVEADKLDYFEKESKAVYTGNVVAIQADSKLTCSMMTIYMEKSAGPTATPAPSPAPTADAQPGPTASAGGVRRMECAGPVTMISKTQTATGDAAAYDKAQNRVTMTGHVTLSDGRNVAKGERLVYDMTTGQATVEAGQPSRSAGPARITSVFIPGSTDGENSAKPSKPKTP